jgi:hypothetical protein
MFVVVFGFLEKKKFKSKKFSILWKNVDEARFDFGLKSRRKKIGGKTVLKNSR